MSEQISVKVHSYGPGRPLALVYFDPTSGKKVAKSAGTSNPRDAERAAAVLQDELNTGRYQAPSKTTWEDFTRRYTAEVLPGLAKGTAPQVQAAFRWVEREVNPKRVADVSAARLSHLVARMREAGRSEATIKKTISHLRPALRWAADIGLLPAVPKFPKAGKRAHKSAMRGRPISGEEFDRLLAAVPGVIGAASAESWRFLLRALWWSGLRLGEALILNWEAGKGIWVDLSGKFPMLYIPGECQKSGANQVHPVAPEFAEMLLGVPEQQRRGRVFKLGGIDNPKRGYVTPGYVADLNWISKVISKIGAAALVRIDNGRKAKWASAHDLRRSFGFRWSRRLMPAELREMMRHADIATTMTFYVGCDAQGTAAAAWGAYENETGNNFGNNRAFRGGPTSREPMQVFSE